MTFYLAELDEEKKSDKMNQIAQEEEEKIKMEQVKLDKKKEKKKRRPRWGFTEGRYVTIHTIYDHKYLIGFLVEGIC